MPGAIAISSAGFPAPARRLDEPRRPGRGAPARLRAGGLHGQRPLRRGAGPGPAHASACSSTPRWSTPRAAPTCSGTSPWASADCSGSWTMRAYVDEAVEQIRRPGGERACHLRALGRGRLVGGRAARAPRHRRPPALHLRRQRRAPRRASGSRSRRSSARCSTCRSSRWTRASASSPSSRASPTRSRSARSSAASSSRSSRRRRAALPGRGARRVPGPGNPLPRRDRERLLQGTLGHHQEPPQRGRPARADEAQAGRAAARALQGRGPRLGVELGLPAEIGPAPALPGAGPRRPRPGRGHRGAARGAAPRRSRSSRRRSRRPASRRSSGSPSPCSSRSGPWA